MYLHYFHSFTVHLDGISLLKPIINTTYTYLLYLSPGTMKRLGLCTKQESRLSTNRITPFSQVVAHTCLQATLFSYPITVPPSEHQLSTACTFSYYKLSTSNTILSSQLGRSLTPPCLLHHTVTLAFGITQEQSWMNTNMTHAKIDAIH